MPITPASAGLQLSDHNHICRESNPKPNQSARSGLAKVNRTRALTVPLNASAVVVVVVVVVVGVILIARE